MLFYIQLAAVALALLEPVAAHMEMSYPPPLRSQYNSAVDQANIDYSMNSPLSITGSDYPCKGYASDVSWMPASATLHAGSSIVSKIVGGAPHEGGSCQYSVSYDGGKTFAVIHSIMGGCPLSSSYTVPIPSNLPSADKALFAWTWFNQVGNPEMYMNCAVVAIKGSSAKSFTGPALYRANVFGYDSCITPRADPVFPNPGDSVAFGGAITRSSKTTVLDSCSINNKADVTIWSSGSSSGGSGDSGHWTDDVTTTTKAVVKNPASTRRTTSEPVYTTPAKTRSTIVSAPTHAPVYDNDKPIDASNPWVGQVFDDPTPRGNAAIKCHGKDHFFLCGGGRCTFMGAVASQMRCSNGEIIVDAYRKERRLISL